MSVRIRTAQTGDVPECARICFEAFRSIAEAHNFPSDFPNVEAAIGLYSALIGSDGCTAVVAEQGGKILGSNLLHGQDLIAGIGPILSIPTARTRASVGS